MPLMDTKKPSRQRCELHGRLQGFRAANSVPSAPVPVMRPPSRRPSTRWRRCGQCQRHQCCIGILRGLLGLLLLRLLLLGHVRLLVLRQQAVHLASVLLDHLVERGEGGGKRVWENISRPQENDPSVQIQIKSGLVE